MAKKTKSQVAVEKVVADSKKASKQLAQKAGSYFDTNVVDRFAKLRSVVRPVLAWLFLIIALSIGVFIQTRQLQNFYMAEVPIHGGVLREGMVGEVTNINPLYASSSADRSLSKLIFSSLVKINGSGEVVSDLARDWQSNRAGTSFSFNLRDNIYWHDGHALTADDIVFTFELIQHPDTGSSLISSWREIKVKADSESKVTFTLPTPSAIFLKSLTGVGILPKHILQDVRPEQLRGHRFNIFSPVGSGPFRFSGSASTNNSAGVIRFRMLSHSSYHLGAPKLDGLNLFVYRDREEMIEDFNQGSLALISGVVVSDIPRNSQVFSGEELQQLADGDVSQFVVSGKVSLVNDNSLIHSVPRTSLVMLFFNMRDEVLKDTNVRRGLALAVNRQEISTIASGYYSPGRSPLLQSHLGYSDKLLQPDVDVTASAQALNRAGWRLRDDGYRYKNDKRLTITVVSQADDIFPEVLTALQKQLKQVGVEVKANLVKAESMQSDYLVGRNFQTLLYGINVGHDPDQMAFWHSSQSGPGGRNLSQYSSAIIDSSLQTGRATLGNELRQAKYETFLRRWLADNPAVVLYEPTFIYANKQQMHGVNLSVIQQFDDRYHNVHRWTINLGRAEMPY